MQEIELKFQVPPAALPALADRLRANAAQAVAMRACYHDSADRVLARAGFALRLRREGEQWVQTLKGRGEGLLHRLEHNATIGAASGAVPEPPGLDLARHAGTPAGAALEALLAGAGLGAADLPVQYETDFLRLAWPCAQGGARIEVALDQGFIRARGQTVVIAELELELLEGAPAALIDLARRWVEVHGLWLDVRSKAERGDRLARGAAPAVVALHGPGSWLEAVLGNAAPLMGGEGDRAHLAALVAALASRTDLPAAVALCGELSAALAVTPPGAAPSAAVAQRLCTPAVQRLWLDWLAADLPAVHQGAPVGGRPA